MSALSEQEIRDAALEAGISPAELKSALLERGGGLPARLMPNAAALAHVSDGTELASEARLMEPPDRALLRVKNLVEQRAGCRGHMRGADVVEIVDENRNLTYRLRSQADGAGGALVRVEVDGQAGRAAIAVTNGVLLAVASALSASFFFLGQVAFAALAFTVSFLLFVGSSLMARKRHLRRLAEAKTLATHAVFDAEEAAPVRG
jgi:hypothetical protein